MQQIVVLVDHTLQRLLRPCLSLQEIPVLVPGLLNLPTFTNHVAVLFLHLFNGLIFPVFHIHNFLRPDDGCIGNLYLIPEDVQRILWHFLYN